MGVAVFPYTIDGGITPVCDSCGIPLCFDISMEEYYNDLIFWDNWKCEECDPFYKTRRNKISKI